MSLTPKQRQLLTFIANYQTCSDGSTPTYEQMRQHMGTKSRTGVHAKVRQLEVRGYVKRKKEGRLYAKSIKILRLIPADPSVEDARGKRKPSERPLDSLNVLIATMRPKIDSARPICAHGEPVKNLPELWTWGGKRA